MPDPSPFVVIWPKDYGMMEVIQEGDDGIALGMSRSTALFLTIEQAKHLIDDIDSAIRRRL